MERTGLHDLSSVTFQTVRSNSLGAKIHKSKSGATESRWQRLKVGKPKDFALSHLLFHFWPFTIDFFTRVAGAILALAAVKEACVVVLEDHRYLLFLCAVWPATVDSSMDSHCLQARETDCCISRSGQQRCRFGAEKWRPSGVCGARCVDNDDGNDMISMITTVTMMTMMIATIVTYDANRPDLGFL